MTKFKIGDRVRYTDSWASSWNLFGCHGIVTDIYNGNSLIVNWISGGDIGSMYVSISHLELHHIYDNHESING